jgi:hypothetical protein
LPISVQISRQARRSLSILPAIERIFARRDTGVAPTAAKDRSPPHGRIDIAGIPTGVRAIVSPVDGLWRA